ncbi:hypothetical protein ACWFR5_46355 [Streptomyces sp. NPDC055092]
MGVPDRRLGETVKAFLVATDPSPRPIRRPCAVTPARGRRRVGDQGTAGGRVTARRSGRRPPGRHRLRPDRRAAVTVDVRLRDRHGRPSLLFLEPVGQARRDGRGRAGDTVHHLRLEVPRHPPQPAAV